MKLSIFQISLYLKVMHILQTKRHFKAYFLNRLNTEGKKWFDQINRTNKEIIIIQFFNFTKPSLMLKVLKNVDNKDRNNDFANTIKHGLTDLKDNIKKISEDEKRIEQPDRVLGLVEEILKFNGQDQKGKD